jgi:hypothetical protein
MKSSADRRLSCLIALPLVVTIVSIGNLANATTIAKTRSKTTAKVPANLELNRQAPVAAGEIDPASANRDRRGREILPPAPIIEPFWSQPNGISESEKSVVPVIKKHSAKSPATIKTKKVSAKPQPISLTLAANTDRQVKLKSITKTKLVLAPKIEIATTSTIEKNIPKIKPNAPKQIATNSRSAFGSNYLRLVRNSQKGTNAVGNPIYTLEAYVNGQKYRSFDAVSGTANTQNLDRHLSEKAAPLPDGTYNVSDRIIGGMTTEVGKTFISIFPRFETERQDLGIHLDPSFNKTNGYDGTAGCIGMTSAADRDAINDFVLKYRPRNLFVKITR